MASEAQKLLQANREGVRFGITEGARQMQERIVALLADAPEIAQRVQQIDPTTIKVKS